MLLGLPLTKGKGRHWDTPVPSETSDSAAKCFTLYEDNGEIDLEHRVDRGSSLTHDLAVAVGVSTTVIFESPHFPKALPV
jgi:hypothetical protein